MFQFTRARGARLLPPSGSFQCLLFQFTRARGARPVRVQHRVVRGVSIHARTGRATYAPDLRKAQYGFNSRAHGARDTSDFKPGCAARFQFTRARGARLFSAISSPRRFQFQFTRARGARHGVHEQLHRWRVSIHARTGRATGGNHVRVCDVRFQFTRARGARPRGRVDSRQVRVSIHARTGRATPHHARHGWRHGFNSRAHGARDLTFEDAKRAEGGFNSRAHGARDWTRPSPRRAIPSFNSRAHGARDIVTP